MLTRIAHHLRRRDHRIRTYLIAMVVGLMVPSLAFTGYLFLIHFAGQQAQAVSDLGDRAAELARALDRQLAANKVLVEVLSFAPAHARGELDRFYGFAKSAAETHGDTITLTKADGTFLLTTSRPFGTPLPHRADMSMYQPVFERGATAVTDAIRGLIIPSHLFLVATPVRVAGEIKYALAMAIKVDRLRPLLAGISEDLLATVVDGNGTLLASNRQSEHFVGQSVPAEVLDRLRHDDSGTMTSAAIDGRLMFLALRRLTEANWWVMVGQPVVELELPLWTWVITFCIFGLAVFSATLMATLRLSGFLARSVKALTAAAAAIDRDEAPSLPLAGLPKEIGTVGHSLIDAAERSRRRSAELRDALHRAEAASRAKTSFLSVMSHELRTPLNAIIGFSALLKEQRPGTSASSQAAEYAGYIHASGQHLLEILTNILDLAKIEAGRMELVPTEIDLVAIADQSMAAMELEARQAGVALARDIAPCACRISADGYALKQVLFNLMSNAIKFTPRGGTVTVRSHCLACDLTTQRRGVSLEVSDTGIGIAPERLQQILEPFVQLDPSLNRARGGAGLGLTVVDRLVRLHGGRMTIASTVGQGTTVTIILPEAPVPLPSPTENDDTAPASESGRSSARK